MILLRSTALRAFAQPSINTGARYNVQPALRRQYANATDAPKASSSVPWILAATIVTAGGTYFAFQPRTAARHSESNHDEKTTHERITQKKDDIKASLIKPERSGKSEENHATASHNNEHKVRKGKFCDDEFDNHITVHSNDPAKDFEKIKKEA